MKILLTGGAGYIGRTICSVLQEHGHNPIILDSLVTGREEFTKGQIFYKGDIADERLVNKIFLEHPDIEITIHLAALIVIAESVEEPYKYYRENVGKSLELFKSLKENGCKKILFSSSASIYGDVPDLMVNEQSPINPRSPYARSKYMMELILEDFCRAYDMKGISLRYFNPIGADPQLRSGAYVKSPSHLLGRLIEATTLDTSFKITGTKWKTRDGSAIRDYIHVWDLALAHLKAIENFDGVFDLPNSEKSFYMAINIGTGNGITVKEFVNAYEKVIGKNIRKEETSPRSGDVIGAYTNSQKGKELIDWSPIYTIEDGIRDALMWEKVKGSIIKY